MVWLVIVSYLSATQAVMLQLDFPKVHRAI